MAENMPPLNRNQTYIALWGGDAWLSRAIRKMESIGKGAPARVNHVSIWYYDEGWDCWVDCGANPRGFYPVEIDPYLPSKDLHSLWRPPTSLLEGRRNNKKLLGMKYDYRGLIGMVGVEIRQSFGLRTKNWLASGAYFCSEAVYKIVKSDPCGSAFITDVRERQSTFDPEEVLMSCEKSDGFDLIYGAGYGAPSTWKPALDAVT